MPRSARRHFVSAAVIGGFALLFAAFLAVTAYHYFTGAEGVGLASFAPGLPAVFLGFLARREWRNGVLTRRTARRLAARK